MTDEEIAVRDAARAKTNAFLASIQNAAASAAAAEAERHNFEPPSDEPLHWDTHGVVRLDVAKEALHLMAAHVCFRVEPNAIQNAIKVFKIGLAKFAVKRAAGLVATRIPIVGTVIDLATDIASFLSAEKYQRNLEKEIRKTSLNIRRDMLKLRLNSEGGPRFVKDVMTRNLESPEKKRKPNKGSGCKFNH